MSGLRIAMVTRRFWPLVGGGEMVMANLAEQFQLMGAKPTILTARWDTQWPRQIMHREVPVQRLPNPPQRGWGTYTYMDALSRWLRTHRSEYDAVLVSMLKHSAYAAIGACNKSKHPVVLRVEGGGDTGDCSWLQTARFGNRIRRRCQQAAAIITPSQATYDEVLLAGFQRPSVHHIPNGVATRSSPPTATEKADARLLLHQINQDLTPDQNTRVAVYTGRLTHRKGLLELVAAWNDVSNQIPNSQLWLVGEGPDREQLYEKIQSLGLVGKIIMPGAFDDVTDLLVAADVFVLPSYMEGLSLSLLEAMAYSLPVVASDIAGNRQLIEDGIHGSLVPVKSIQPLADAIRQAFVEDKSNQISAAQTKVSDNFSLTTMAQAHLNTLENAIQPPGVS
ncbi:MAG: glycosyltransferase family 4 protein [Planctomycetota bacterium]|nr:glycosyltransferase family 4 protein [Planctomycetota bacterium]